MGKAINHTGIARSPKKPTKQQVICGKCCKEFTLVCGNYFFAKCVFCGYKTLYKI